jgi:hypothetical protein
MGKRKNIRSQQKFNAADGTVTLFCLLGAFFSFWFFWQDLNRVIKRNQDPVATITFKQRAAQRRLGDRVLWDRLRQESPVYDGDFIRTAELSGATVTFNRERKVNLSENSLIQIRTIGDQAVIDLASGDVSVENSGPSAMVLVSGDKQVELSGIMKARAAEDGGFELEVLEGTAVLISEEGRVVREAGQSISIDSEGRTRERPRVVMINPRPDEELISQGDTLGVDFSWVPAGFIGTEQVRLEIAGDRRFTRSLESLDTENSGALVELPPGTYWWRAYVSSSGPQDVSPEKLIILPPATVSRIPVIAAPVPVETASEAPPETPPAPAVPLPLAPPPEKTPPEEPAPRTPPPLLPAVTELRPENTYRIGPAQIRQSRSLSFRWKEAPGANGYIFTLRETSGKNILSEGPLAETSYTLDLRRIGRGNFVWQVEAVREHAGIIEQRGMTAENSFTVDIPLPSNPRPQDPGPLYGIDPP